MKDLFLGNITVIGLPGVANSEAMEAKHVGHWYFTNGGSKQIRTLIGAHTYQQPTVTASFDYQPEEIRYQKINSMCSLQHTRTIQTAKCHHILATCTTKLAESLKIHSRLSYFPRVVITESANFVLIPNRTSTSERLILRQIISQLKNQFAHLTIQKRTQPSRCQLPYDILDTTHEYANVLCSHSSLFRVQINSMSHFTFGHSLQHK